MLRRGAGCAASRSAEMVQFGRSSKHYIAISITITMNLAPRRTAQRYMGLYEWAAVWRACRWPISSFKKLRPRLSGLAAGRMPVSRLFMTYAGSASGAPAPAPRARPSPGRLSFPASRRCSGPAKSANECRPTWRGPLERVEGVSRGNSGTDGGDTADVTLGSVYQR